MKAVSRLSSAFLFLVCGSVWGQITCPPDGVIIASCELAADHSGNIVIAQDRITLDCKNRNVIGPGQPNPAINLSVGILLAGRTGVTVTGCNVSGFAIGFLMMGSQANTFRDNVARNNTREGFSLQSSNDNFLIGNTSTMNGRDGIELDDANGNTLSANTANANGRNGIELDRSNRNVIDRNTANDNGTSVPRSGISLDASSGNKFSENTANNNARNGFRIENNSNDNLFAVNTFTGNTEGGIVMETNSARNLDAGGNTEPIPFFLPGD